MPNDSGVVIDRSLERLERVVDAGGRRCDRARQLANGGVRGSRCLGERKTALRECLGKRRDGIARRGTSFAQQIIALGDRLRQRRRLTLQAGERRIGRGDGTTRLIDGGIHIANRIAHLAQSVGCFGHRTCKRILSLGCLVLKVDACILGDTRHGLAHRRDKLRVDLLLDGVRTGVGDLGRNGALLLIDVVRELGLMVVAIEHRDQVIREILGDHDRRIVLTALDALFSIGGRIDESPAQLVVLLELIDDFIARVELAHQVVLGALVVIGDGDLDALGVSIRIPVGHDVVPGIQRRNNAHTKGNHQGDGVHKQSLNVALKNRKGDLCIG